MPSLRYNCMINLQKPLLKYKLKQLMLLITNFSRNDYHKSH